MAQIVQVDPVVLGYVVRQIAEQRNVERAKSTFFARRLDPGEMREMRVDAASHHLGVDLLELVHAIRKGEDLGGTDEGTI